MSKIGETLGALGHEIRRLRLKRGFKLLDLAKHIGKTAGYLSRVEARDEIPNAEIICLIAEIVHAKPEALLELAKQDTIRKTSSDLDTKHEQALILYRRQK